MFIPYIHTIYSETFLKTLKGNFLVIDRLMFLSDHLWHYVSLLKQMQASGLAKLLVQHCYVGQPTESQISFLFSFKITA